MADGDGNPISTGVLESACFIYQNANDVTISDAACKRAAESVYCAMQEKSYSTQTWSSNLLNPRTKDASTVDWIFLVDLLNFSFWSDVDSADTGKSESNRFTVSWDGKAWTGYWSLCALVNRALVAGVPITTATFWNNTENCSDELLEYVFRSETSEQVPLLSERIACLREAGRVLTEKFDGSFINCIERAGGSAVALVTLIVENFPCFKDEALYKGRPVKIYKRAQILVADIWACFNQQSYGYFRDIDQISMFADYRVPQILYNLGCLQYSDALTSHIRSLNIIPNGDPWEVELRGCSIWSVEMIKSEILKAHPDAKINAILLDFYLWDTAKEIQQRAAVAMDSIPCHRTRSFFY
ncbi:hypothetical protein V1517DRAFT_326353 [Lipomyces orientalis]|uniref:Uncharacterized protein n=1 Tax=Lipomyces orientalis TaxID=1233043 RepID=A0ACC3TKF8_9ASCO